VFDTLSDKLQRTLGDLRGRGRLDDESVSKAMREIRLALLEADVNLQVVKGFVARVKERAVGEDVTKSITPGQQVVKIVHEELTEVMGGGDSRLAFAGRPPTVILLVGLQGSGKTTAAAKLALMLRKEGKQPALVAADLQRPAAIDQLDQLGRQIQVSVYADERADPVGAARKGVEWAKQLGADAVIVDTAGAADGGTRANCNSNSPAECAARPRRDDWPGGGQRGYRIPGAGLLRRHLADEARR
jgi:signal recognition particle subunit SRP54